MALDVPSIRNSDVVKIIEDGDRTIVVFLYDEYVQVLTIEPKEGERQVTNNKRIPYGQWLHCVGIEDMLDMSMRARRL